MKPNFKQYLKRMVDSPVVSPEEIESVLGTPVVGVIPLLERRKSLKQTANSVVRRVNPDGRWRSRLLNNFPSPSPVHDAYGIILKQMIDPSAAMKRVFMVCGATATEGATTTAANIALSAAMSGI